jgi:hypothetical protein
MSNPTTPFSWQMPTATDLVTDLPADFEVFGQAVATSMADLLGGTSGQVLAKNSNTDMDFVWVTSDDANAIQNTIVDAKGDLIAATAADTPARLAVGTNGQVLQADSTASTGLKWATPSGGGKLLQVVSATTTSSYSNATTTFTDVTGLTATITPTLATSKILVMISASCAVSSSSGIGYVGAKLLRGATSLVDWNSYGFIFAPASGILEQVSVQYYDSPNTTSATTYKMQSKIDTAANSMTATWQYINTPSVITLLEIGA